MTLPSLLPKRRQRQSAEFLLDPLYFALEQYAKENTLPHYRECVVCFAQVYDQALPTRRVRDYDNLEEKQILDLLSSFVMADDTGLLCDAYNTAELGEQDCTMIFVMEKHRFPGWLAEHKSSLKSISDFEHFGPLATRHPAKPLKVPDFRACGHLGEALFYRSSQSLR